MYVYGANLSKIVVQVCGENNDTIEATEEYTNIINKLNPSLTDFIRVEMTFKALDASHTVSIYGYPQIQDTKTPILLIANCKLELGTHATKFTKCPIDVSLLADKSLDEISKLKSRVTEAELKITPESIIAEVTSSEQYTNDINRIASSVVEQTANEIRTSIKSVTDSLDGADVIEKVTWFTLDQNGLRIGKSNDNFSVLLSNEKLSFYDGQNEVAYISNKTLLITQAHINQSFRLGNLVAYVYGDGSINYEWE